MIIGLPTARKPLIWIASSRRDLKRQPVRVKQVLTYAIFLAELGRTHPNAKPMKGFGGAGVVEVAKDYDGDTYRAVYTVKFDDVVYVLDVFQKKSKRGKATPQADMDRIRSRLKLAQEHYEANYRKQTGTG